MGRDSKEQMIIDVLSQYMGNVVDYKREILALLQEALEKKTIKELRSILDE